MQQNIIQASQPQTVQSIEPVTPLKPPKKKLLKWIIAAVIIILLGVAIFYFQQSLAIKQISGYEDCIQAKGSLIQESYPAVCVTKDGRRFTQNLIPPTPSPAAENEVLGFQTTACCSCPTKVSASIIGTNGWVIYEKGKNYSSLLPDECKRVNCAPCPPLEETSAKAKECYAKTQCEGPMPCMANPASVFCTCMGGELETRENDQGQSGVCLIDGQEYDEWEYFRKMNPSPNPYTQ